MSSNSDRILAQEVMSSNYDRILAQEVMSSNYDRILAQEVMSSNHDRVHKERDAVFITFVSKNMCYSSLVMLQPFVHKVV